MEPSFLLDGVSNIASFLPPKYEYQCTQMSIKQLERLNGGYRPAFARRDPILPQTGNLVKSSIEPPKNSTDIEEERQSTVSGGFVSAQMGCEEDTLNISDSFLNTGNVSILAATMDGIDVWRSEESSDAGGLLSVDSSTINYKSAGETTPDDNIPSPFLNMVALQTNEADEMFSPTASLLSQPQTPIDESVISYPGKVVHSVAEGIPTIIPISVGFTDCGPDSLLIQEFSRINSSASGSVVVNTEGWKEDAQSTVVQDCCAPVVFKALRKRLPPEIGRKHFQSNVANVMASNSSSSHTAVPAPVLRLPPILASLQRKPQYCGYVRTIPSEYLTKEHDHLHIHPNQDAINKASSALPNMFMKVKTYNANSVISAKKTVAPGKFTLPKLKR